MKKTMLFSMLFLSGCAESAESALLTKISVGDCVDIKQSSSSVNIPGETLSLFNQDIVIPSRSTTVEHDSFIIDVYKGSNRTCAVDFNKEVLKKKQKITEVGPDFIVIDDKKIIPVGRINEINLLDWKKFYESTVEWEKDLEKYRKERVKKEKEADEKRKNQPPDDGISPGRKLYGDQS